jgi:hypothetical protein
MADGTDSVRVLGRHSGKASLSVQFLALREDLFPVRGITGGSSPSVALGEGFPECFCVLPMCIWHSGIGRRVARQLYKDRSQSEPMGLLLVPSPILQLCLT